MIFFILLPWAAQILDKTIHVDHIFSREDNLTRTNTHLLPFLSVSVSIRPVKAYPTRMIH